MQSTTDFVTLPRVGYESSGGESGRLPKGAAMLINDGVRLYSASDLVNFLGCTHATFLDLGHLVNPVQFPPDDEQAKLLQEKGIEHERAYLERLRADGRVVVEIAAEGGLSERVARTAAAMRDGAEVIYQGALLERPWHGYSDFLLKVEGVPSALGDWAYDVADTKLSRSAKPKHVLQLCVYAELIGAVQEVLPPRMHVVLGSGEVVTLQTSAVAHYYSVARGRFEAYADAPGDVSAGEPCGHCRFCRWSEACEAEWEAADHLSIVAGITRGQIERLRAVGVNSIGNLAAVPRDMRVPGIQPAALERLVAQAGLQHHSRRTGENRLEVLPLERGRGFDRLPRPDPGDIFFDMEGDPLFEEGLEYLFGLVCTDDGEERFHAFWAHDREAEKKAFQDTIDFVVDRLARHPAAHVYHYASYEESALKRLAMYHGTREAEVDDLLRRGKLVDLYKVVKEGTRVSEPRYSIKNLEHFYLEEGRTGAVTNAGDSIVIYERWRRVGGDGLLAEIASYNELDCRSTRMCRDWLLTFRPDGATWFVSEAVTAPDPAKEQARTEAEQRTASLMEALVRTAPAGEEGWRVLLGHLLEFHRREAKPSWWAMFARQTMSEEELIDDAESIGAVTPLTSRPPRPEKRSTVFSFTFPPQDLKMRIGDKPVLAGSLDEAGEIFAIDDDARVIELKVGPTKPRPADRFSLIPCGPIGDKVLRDAVYRYAEAVAAGNGARYGAVTAILRKEPPCIEGLAAGEPVVHEGADLVPAAVSAISRLGDSYLLVQGPPGAGKTYTSARAIVELIAAGRRVGVASNSHKAINNLLAEVEKVAREQGVRFSGVKKSSREDQFLNGSGLIVDTTDNKGVLPAHRLVAGVAWLFARPDLDLAFDHLFVDEAGQVSLANIVAMGLSARNIVLVGDQMQLSQPIQGTHPGGSGVSGLDHLLAGHSTVPPDRGIFLPVTRRMHPDLCRFVSDAVYDGRLEADGAAAVQRLHVDCTADPEALAPAGLRFVSVDHVGCAQRSEEEAARLAAVYARLLGSEWTDREGRRRPVTIEDILVVSPYNMQVDLLRRSLPVGARVGTVDKFQGQEAAAVLVSMATSSGEDLPRNIEFLYSRNRLNVAVSRSRCLAVIFASPRLLEISCSTIAQMELVNGLCWAKVYSETARAAE